MKKTTKAFMFLGGASIVIAGLGLAACSSTTTTVVDNGDASGGMDGKAGGDGAGSDGGTGSDTGMNDAMAQGDCKVATLHAPKTDAGPFCPFVGGVAPGANCNVGEYCCKPGISPGRCVAAGAGGANPCMAMETAFQCDDDVNCNGPNGGGTCCGTGTIKQDATCVGTQAYFGSGFNLTKCSAACGVGDAGALRMCSNPAECMSPLVCTPFRAHYGQFAACQ